MDYSIYNRSNTTQSFAAWEVTRVHPEVLTVYPSQKNKFKSPFPVTHKYGAVWLDYKQSPVTDGAAKLIGDGERGWLAHIYKGKVFLKLFTDLRQDQTAPQEGEVEIYRHPTLKYAELEVQGPYQRVAPGDAAQVQVVWFAVDIPQDIRRTAENLKLLSFIQKTVDKVQQVREST